jgi:hypothetical protein
VPLERNLTDPTSLASVAKAARTAIISENRMVLKPLKQRDLYDTPAMRLVRQRT